MCQFVSYYYCSTYYQSRIYHKQESNSKGGNELKRVRESTGIQLRHNMHRHLSSSFETMYHRCKCTNLESLISPKHFTWTRRGLILQINPLYSVYLYIDRFKVFCSKAYITYMLRNFLFYTALSEYVLPLTNVCILWTWRETNYTANFLFFFVLLCCSLVLTNAHFNFILCRLSTCILRLRSHYMHTSLHGKKQI